MLSTLVNSHQKQAVFERLCQRNAIRRQIGVRPMDVPSVFKRKIRLMTEQRYLELLEPYLVAAFGSVDWPEGFTPRILLATKLHKQAMEDVRRDHDVADPRTKNPDIMKIIETFAPATKISG